MKRQWAKAALLLAALAGMAGCKGDVTGPETRREIVLFGFLYIGETVSEENAVFLSRTAPVDEVYRTEDLVIEDALVTLRKEGSEETDTLAMVEPGYYANGAVTIEPRTTYHLSVRIDGEDPVTATTTTPYPFEVYDVPKELPERMVHSSVADSFPITLACDEEEQIFLVDVYCLEDWENAFYISPFGDHDKPEDYSEYGGDNGEPRHIAPYFRVGNLEAEDDLYRIGWYGDLMYFYGEYEVQVLSIDDNYYNYLYRDHPELCGGVDGAIGVFGSACRERWVVEVVE